MPEEKNNDFGTHADFIGRVRKPADTRVVEITNALKKAFINHIRQARVDVIIFKGIPVMELAKAIKDYPVILKPLVAACNIAGRAIARDLLLKNMDTYKPRLTDEQSAALAGYIKPFLPPLLSIPAIVMVDRVAFIDKEIRKSKGQWEKLITVAINEIGGKKFKKRKFKNGREIFELDAAYPESGTVEVGIDIKRIEARQDIHKRSDEIINKARNFKAVYPKGKFGAVIYYPFIDEQVNVQGRLNCPEIDSIVFAGESKTSIDTAVNLLLSKFG